MKNILFIVSRKKVLVQTKFLAISLVLLMVLGLSSCGSDDDEGNVQTYPEENPLQGYLSSAGFSVKEEDVNLSNYEFGIEFTPLVKGKINALILNIPDVNANLRVTVWDATTKTVLRTEYVNVGSSNINITKEISAIFLEKDKKYMITFNSDVWFLYTKPDHSSATYPITSGNIRIERYGYSNGASQIYPITFSNIYYAGDLTFKFQRTE